MRSHQRARQSHATPDRGERTSARRGGAFIHNVRVHIATREPQPRVARVRTRGDGRRLALLADVGVQRGSRHAQRAVRTRHEPLRVEEAGGGVLRPKGGGVAAVMPEHTSGRAGVIDMALEFE